MGARWVVIAIAGIVCAIGVPFFVAHHMQLGAHAKSPQEAKLFLGSTVLVAGGRAKLWFAGGNTGGDFEIACSKDTKYFEPDVRDLDAVYEGCGIGVQLKEVEEKEGRPSRAVFEITWSGDK